MRRIRKRYIETPLGVLDRLNKEHWTIIIDGYIVGKEEKYRTIQNIADYLGVKEGIVKSVFKYFEVSITLEERRRRASLSQKETLIKNYGVSNISQLQSVKDKKIQNSLEKYGTPHVLQAREVKDKIIETCLAKYGEDNVSKAESTLKKIKDTKKERYGDENYNNREKAKITYPKRTEEDRDKILKTRHEKTKNKFIKLLEDNNFELLEEYRGKHKVDDGGKYLGWEKYKIKCHTCGNVIESDLNELPICYFCVPANKSVGEKRFFSEVLKFEEVVLGSRDVIPPYEIDIFVPELNIGFEYNGSYWHSSIHDRIGKYYHKKKTGYCFTKNVKLYHIWEHDNEEIVKSMIRYRLGKTENKYYARKLKIKEVNSKERQLFFDSNHLHGDVKSSFALGLYQEEELISCISFRKHKEGIEIARFATKLNSCCVGGFEKLLKYSIPKIKELGYKKIITYCDRDWTPNYKDSVYYKNGFTFIKDTGCSLSYVKGGSKPTVYSRETFQKHKLKELFPETYSDDKTADEILIENKVYPIYNSGNWKFELEP